MTVPPRSKDSASKPTPANTPPAANPQTDEPESLDSDRRLEDVVRWLEGVADEPERLATLPAETLRRIRKAAGHIAFPERSERRALAAERKRALRERIRVDDDAKLDATSNRALKRSLRFSVPPANAELSSDSRALLELHAAGPALAPQAGDSDQERDASPRKLHEAQNCYICKADYDELHHHYDTLCPDCARLNWEKRSQTADLSNRVALVTGARVKIGFEAAVMLLRAGAEVIVTTRFPGDAARRFAALPDASDWEDRLSIFGLDLRHTPSIETLTRHLCEKYASLDFLIHNACQTVRRPPAYYKHLVGHERLDDLDARSAAWVSGHRALIQVGSGQVRNGSANEEVPLHETQDHSLASSDSGSSSSSDSAFGPAHAPMTGIAEAATLNQVDLLGENVHAHLFPDGMLDGDGQQLDLRDGNSWRMNLADVPTLELLEVQLVNSIAPFVLTSRLKPLMMRSSSHDKHVVNVSAMEGQFYRNFKTTRHPHTNMAKAALNMMTRTSAADFVRDGIHMNSVDTGWVTDEDPFEKMVRKESEQRFAPPLDSVDGAARVVDPIFSGFNTGTHCWGQFLKDYVPTRW